MKQFKKKKNGSSDKRKRSFAVWWIVPIKWLRFKVTYTKSTKAPFTTGQDWIIGTFFPQKSGYGWRNVDPNSLPTTSFLTCPPNLLASPPSLQSPYYFSQPSSVTFFSFAFSLFIQFVLWIDRILTKLWLKFWDDNEDFSMRISLWSALCSSRNVIS